MSIRGLTDFLAMVVVLAIITVVVTNGRNTARVLGAGGRSIGYIIGRAMGRAR